MVSRHFSLQWVLVSYGLAVSIPLVVVLGIFVFQATEFRREQLEQRLQQVANSIAENIDRDIDRNITLLTALASSPLVAKQEWAAFYDQAKAALKLPAYVVLVDLTGRQLVNTFVPFREAPPFTGDPKSVQEISARPKPVVSNLFTSLVVKRPVYNISIPVLIDGKPQYILSLGLLPDVLQRILLDQGLDAGWIATVWGGDGVIMARSHEHDRFLGSKGPPAFSTQGTVIYSSSDRNGQGTLVAQAHSRLSDLRVAVSYPLQEYSTAFNRTLFAWVATALVGIAFAVVVALYLGSRLARPFIDVAAMAKSLGNNKPVESPSTWVSEAHYVAATFREASDRQNLLMRELIHRVKNILAVVHALVVKTIIDGRTPKEMREDISGRLKALALAHDAFINNDARGASLSEIVKGELGVFQDRVNIAGAPIVLSATSAQNFALIIHELSTNALKHGALSSADGKVFVDWKTDICDGVDSLFFTWRETNGPKVTKQVQPGFGSKLLETVFTPHRPEIRLDNDGFTFQLCVPLAMLHSAEI
jgi:two-component sensor histidine kinase